jgi:AcrR family transcriptional regulator
MGVRPATSQPCRGSAVGAGVRAGTLHEPGHAGRSIELPCQHGATRGPQRRRTYHVKVGRPAKFSSEQIIDAAMELVAGGGPGAATVPAIAGRLGAPSGSIYHRFSSRDLILAHVWLRGVRASQAGFVACLEEPGQGRGVAAALHLLAWTRRHPAEAQVLILHRREDLAAQWPAELGDELASLNDGIVKAIRGYARWRYGRATRDNLEVVTFALIDVPYAAMRRHLNAGRPPPAGLDELISSTVTHLLGPDA